MGSATVLVTFLFIAWVNDCSGAIENNDKNKVWKLQIGHDYGAYEYMDTSGYLTGFTYDLISEVCLAAGINCVTIWDAYTNCWDSQPGQPAVGGKGLMGGWYDACMNYYMTVERLHVFQFSEDYLKPPKTYFYTKPNSAFDESDMKGKVIGFIGGWASDEKCLGRQSNIKNNVLPPQNVMYFKSSDQLKDAIITGKVAAGFSTGENMDPYVSKGILKRGIFHDYSCVLSGDGVMARKGNDFVKHWNNGFRIIRANGKFSKMCAEASKKHGLQGTIDCVQT